MDNIETVDKSASLIIFTSRFNAMFDMAGCSLMRILAATTDVPGPVAASILRIAELVGSGETLSNAMGQFPDLFPKFYVALIRAGEVGGVLDVTIDRTEKLLILQRRVAKAAGIPIDTVFARNESATWSDLSYLQKTASLLIFTETLSVLFSSGAPVLYTFDCGASTLPKEQAEAFQTVIHDIRTGNRALNALEAMGIFPKFWLRMFDSGEQSGTLDIALHVAAGALEAELTVLM